MTTGLVGRRHELIAVGLRPEDTRRLEAAWDPDSRARNADRRRFCEEVGAKRAREWAAALRSARVGVPPLGSVCLARYYRRHGIPRMSSDAGLREAMPPRGPAPLLRFANGKAWWVDGYAASGWEWPRGERLPFAVRVLALGLTDVQLHAVARCSQKGLEDDELRAAVEAHLRAEDWL